MGGRGNRQITTPAQGVVEGSARLLLTKNRDPTVLSVALLLYAVSRENGFRGKSQD